MLFGLANEFRFNVDTGKRNAFILIVIWMTVDDAGNVFSGEDSIAFIAKYMASQLLRMNSAFKSGDDSSLNPNHLLTTHLVSADK